jgi:uncharacterized membrane protein YdjX (TVP38/TMEM64 family)
MLQSYNAFILLIENSDKATAAFLLIVGKIFSGIFFLPGTPLTLLSGVVLGKWLGTAVAIVGNTLGATLAFLLARYILKKYVQEKILVKYPKIKEYEDLLFKRGFYTVVFLRLIPLFPFNALNFLLAVTKVKFKDYFLGTIVGIIPGTVAFAVSMFCSLM